MATCENSRKTHTCHGPLFLIEENREKRVLCLPSVKYLILRGHDIEIIRAVPRELDDEQEFVSDF